MPEKKREHKENKTIKKLVLLKHRITVEATLWWKFVLLQSEACYL